MDNKFSDYWNVWYHHTKDNWTIDGYKKIFKIDNIDKESKDILRYIFYILEYIRYDDLIEHLNYDYTPLEVHMN